LEIIKIIRSLASGKFVTQEYSAVGQTRETGRATLETPHHYQKCISLSLLRLEKRPESTARLNFSSKICGLSLSLVLHREEWHFTRHPTNMALLPKSPLFASVKCNGKSWPVHNGAIRKKEIGSAPQHLDFPACTHQAPPAPAAASGHDEAQPLDTTMKWTVTPPLD